jgi:ferredoxin-like protein FixX
MAAKYQRGYQKPFSEERQTMQWPKEKEQKNKQCPAKNFTENDRLSNTMTTCINAGDTES